MGNADLWVKIDDKVIHARRHIPETECFGLSVQQKRKVLQGIHEHAGVQETS